MTNRYDLLINAIRTTNETILMLALFAVLIITAYHSLVWTPAFMRRPAKYLYLATMLVLSVLTTVYFGQ